MSISNVFLTRAVAQLHGFEAYGALATNNFSEEQEIFNS
jgi:hypothetical protein